MNDVNSPGVSRPAAISRLPYQSAAAIATPPSSSISGGSARQRARDLHVRPVQRSDARSNFSASRASAAERLDDAVARERLGADVRHVLERFLAAPRGAPHALPEPDQRIDDQRRARSGRRAPAGRRSRTAGRRTRRSPATRASDRRWSPTRRAAPGRRRWSPGTSAARWCAARRSRPTDRGCGENSVAAGRGRRAGRRRPSGTRKSRRRGP